MFYANSQNVHDKTITLVDEEDPPPRAVLIDAIAQDALDVTSAEVMAKVFAELRARGIEVFVAEVHAPVREVLRKMGTSADLMPDDHIFPTLSSAVEAFEASRPEAGGTPG
jgi:SulP family sulfate permease